MKRLLILTLIFIACKKGESGENDYALYGIFCNLGILVGFYDVKNSQVISDASIYLNEKKLDYVHPFYRTSYAYISKSQYTLKVYYKEISEDINFQTIEVPETLWIYNPPRGSTIPLYQNVIIKWNIDHNYYTNYDYYYMLFLEDKSKNPTLVYSVGPLPKQTDSIVIPGSYINTRNTTYQITLFLINYQVLDKFKPYPGYNFSFIATGEADVVPYPSEP